MLSATSYLSGQTGCTPGVRLNAFPAALVGSWAETADQCGANDKSTISIESAKYGDANETCAVLWIQETPGSEGTNYAVHARCTDAKDQTKTQIADIIVRPQGNDRASMGRSFQDLKTYQRCPNG